MRMYFEFANPVKLLSGDFALENIASELRQLEASRPMILTDDTLKKIGSLSCLEKALADGGVKPAGIYTEIPLDSSVSVVNEIASHFRISQADSLIALGGGSVIDTAKGVRMLLSQGGKDLMNFRGAEVLPRGRFIPFVVVPTTSGTGSEATGVAVIKDVENQVKLEFTSNFLVPDVAVLDIRMLETMPARITALTGLDALSHAIEAYSSMQRNPVSEAYAISAIRLIMRSLEKAVVNPRDKEARLDMANAAFLAGASFSNSMVGIVHAIGHSVGAVSHVPHGEAMAILLCPGMRYNIERNRQYYAELLEFVAGPEIFCSTAVDARAEMCISSLEEFMGRLKAHARINLTLHDAGVSRDDFRKIAERSISDGALIVNRRDAGVQEIEEILEAAY